MNRSVLKSLGTELGVADVPEREISSNEERSGPVNRFLDSFQRVQEQTAQKCLRVAEKLEDEATRLRNHAATLVQQGKQIPQDVKNATSYEIDVRRHVEYWGPLMQSESVAAE